jgi:pilus assembly protein CpaE
MAISKVAEASTGDPFGAAAHERAVPRISIDAFCAHPDTLAVMQRAAADRRLSKATVTIHPGGVSEAISFFGQNQTPNLLIIETGSEGNAVLGELEQLAGVCDEKTKVVVIGRSNDVHLYRKLRDRGISEYLVAPLNPLQLIETISTLYLNPNAPPVGRAVVLTGARGGAGASTIAHNIGWYIAEGLNINTAIVDFDLPFGTACLNFNQDSAQGALEALIAPERLDDVLLDRLLTKCSEHLSLLAAPAVLDREYDIGASAFESLLDQLRASVPAVIVDLPHAWTPWSRQTLHMADEIVIVATPDLASLRNTRNILDAIQSRRTNDTPPKIVLNQTAVAKRPEIPLKEFKETIGVDPVLVLPFDPALFGTAANNGQMLAQVQPNSRAAEGMRVLAEMITGRSIAQRGRNGALSLLPFLNRKAG